MKLEKPDPVELAAVKLLIAIAFLVPKGADVQKALREELIAYKEAVEARAVQNYVNATR